jgi:hypothetical protein
MVGWAVPTNRQIAPPASPERERWRAGAIPYSPLTIFIKISVTVSGIITTPITDTIDNKMYKKKGVRNEPQ